MAIRYWVGARGRAYLNQRRPSPRHLCKHYAHRHDGAPPSQQGVTEKTRYSSLTVRSARASHSWLIATPHPGPSGIITVPSTTSNFGA